MYALSKEFSLTIKAKSVLDLQSTNSKSSYYPKSFYRWAIFILSKSS